MNDHASLLRTLTESDFYRDYARAYSDATGLPVALCGTEVLQPPFRGKARENPFCALMGTKNAGCAACLRMQERLAEAASAGPAIAKCHFGLTEAAVPLKLGPATIGFLRTGQVFTQKPGSRVLRKIAATMRRIGLDLDPRKVRDAYMATRIIPRSQLASATRLLEIFADHLATKSNQLVVRQANTEPLAVMRAKRYILEHLDEKIHLGEIAKAAYTTHWNICRLFKRHTGLRTTDYVSRLRIEKAKELLMRPNRRISEVAYEVGFQSLTHFNRRFHALVGESPTAYREKVSLPLAA